ncbi:MAG: KH domain-containing protein [Evtepia gabavorous]
MVIGKGGAEIERLRLELEKKLGKPVALNIVEVKTPDTDAQLVARTLPSSWADLLPPRHEELHGPRHGEWAPAASRVMCSGRLGGAKSPTASATMGHHPCRPSAPISTTALPRLPHLWPHWHQGLDLQG